MAKPRLEKTHWAITALWLAVIVVGSGWLASALSGPCDGCVFEGVPWYLWFLVFLVPSSLVLGLVVLAARFIAAKPVTRSSLLIGLPALLVVWLVILAEWI
jgi:hypothetical protein